MFFFLTEPAHEAFGIDFFCGFEGHRGFHLDCSLSLLELVELNGVLMIMSTDIRRDPRVRALFWRVATYIIVGC